MVFVPSRGFLFFYRIHSMKMMIAQNCFRPLTGISLFLLKLLYLSRLERRLVFVPSRGFLFFYRNDSPRCADDGRRFSSPHGDFSFSIERLKGGTDEWIMFSSPHGDFSFSISICNFFILNKMVFVPSRGFLFFYNT